MTNNSDDIIDISDIYDISDIIDISDISDITDQDIYDADLSSDGNDERVVQIPEIENTIWFKQIIYYPLNLAEMDFFLAQMDILHVFKNLVVNDILKMGFIRLDALLFILKKINLETVKFCEHIISAYFEKQFNELFFSKIMVGSNYKNMHSVNTFLDEFHMDISEYTVRFLTLFQKIIEKETDPTKEISNKLMRYCHRLLHSDYYKIILNEFGVTVKRNFFEENRTFFEDAVKNMINYTCSIMKPILILIRNMSEKFFDKGISDAEVFKFVSDNMNIEELFNSPSDAIDEFIMLLMENLPARDIDREKPTMLSNYDNFLYSYDHKLESRKYAFWLNTEKNIGANTYAHYSYNNEKSKRAAEKLGFELHPKTPMTEILMPFVLNNFVKSTSDLVKKIASIMEDCRKEPGIFNQFDEIDLETSYLLISTSNDIKDTYDSFLDDLKRKSVLPFEYPIEFVLRLVSRILNVSIKFYDNNMICTQIDNILYQIYEEPIMIYQQNFMQYYILHAKDQPFVPLCSNNIDMSQEQIQNIHIRTKKTKKVRFIEI